MTITPKAILYIVIVSGLLLLSSFAYFSSKKKDSDDMAERNNIASLSETRQKRLELAQAMLYTNPDSARYFARKNLQCIESVGGSDFEIISYTFLLGSSYFYQSQYNKALGYYYLVLQQALDVNDATTVANVYHNIGLVHSQLRNFKDAVDFIRNAVNTYEKLGVQHNKYTAINNLGRIYLEVGDLERAGKYFERSYVEFHAIDYPIGIAGAANHLAVYYQQLAKPDSALHYFNEAMQVSQAANNNYGLSVVHYFKGNFFLESLQYDKAVHHYKQSDSIASISNYISSDCFPDLGLARVNMQQGNYDQAIAYARQALGKAEALENTELKSIAHNTLSVLYEQGGEIGKAYAHYRASTELHQELQEQTRIFRIYNLEVEQLSKELERREMEIRNQELLLDKRRNFIILIIIASISAIIIVFLLFKHFADKMQQAQQEKMHADQIRHANEKHRVAMMAEIKERERLGMELHDGLGPLIFLTKLNVAGVLENNAHLSSQERSLLYKTNDSLNEMFREVKQMSKNLAPLVLMEKGFIYSLRALVAKLRHLTKLNIKLSIHHFNHALSQHVEHELFRTVQELLNNVLQHAKASMVNIELLQTDDEMTIMIEDDGIGFDSKQDFPGIGLSAASSRVERLGGEFLVDSQAGRGTIITILLPLTEEVRDLSLTN